MQAVKIGSLVDEEGESVSDVATVMKEYGIDIMEVTDNLNNMGALLDLLGSKWDSYTTAQKSEIATTVAGIRQREKFIVLMDKYDRALELEQVSLESAGSAMAKYSIYQESVEAKINTLKTSITELYDTTLNSDIVKFAIDLLTKIINLTDAIGGLGTVLVFVVGLITAIKAQSIIAFLGKLLIGIKDIFAALVTGVVTVNTVLGLIGLLATALSVVFGAINAVNKAQQESMQAVKDSNTELQKEIANYRELASELAKLENTTNKTESQDKRLIAIKEQLAKATGDYRSEVEATTEAEKNYTLVAIESEKVALRKWIAENRKGFEAGKRKQQHYARGFESYDAVKESVKSTISYYESQPTLSKDQQDILAYQYEILENFEKLDETVDTFVRNEAYLNFLETQGTEVAKLNDLMAKYEISVNNANESLDENAEANIELQKQAYAALQEQIKYIESLKGTNEAFNAIIDEILAKINVEINAFTQIDRVGNFLAKERRKLQTEKNEWLKSLETENELLEKQKKVQEALLAIEQAKINLKKAQERTVQIYEEGKGFVWQADQTAIAKANEDLANAQENLLKAQEDLNVYLKTAEYDKKIDALKKVEEEWKTAWEEKDTAKMEQIKDDFVKTNLTLKDGFTKAYDLMKEWFDYVKKPQTSGGTTSTKRPTVSTIKTIEEANEYLASSPTGGTSLKDLQDEKFLSNKFKKYHDGGIVGEGSLDPTTEQFAKLAKGEFVATVGQQQRIVDLVNSKTSASNNIVIDKLNLDLPNIKNGEEFANYVATNLRNAIIQKASSLTSK